MADSLIEEISIEIGLSALMHSDGHNPPDCEVWIDDNKLFDGKITELTADDKSFVIKENLSLKDDEHELKVILKNKTKYDTVGNADWTVILEDQLLTIDYVELEEVNLGHLILKCAAFTKQDGEVLPDMFQTIGYNGTFVLKFSTPIYEWFLSNI